MSKTTLILLIGVSLLVVYLGILSVVRFGDQSAPRVTLVKPFDPVGPGTVLSLQFEDLETGLREISVHIEQNLESFPIAHEQFPSHGLLSFDGGSAKIHTMEVTPFADDSLPRRRGLASLVITAKDYSWRRFLQGNELRFKHEFSVKFTPPRLEVLSSHDPLPQGGSGLVFYRVSEDATTHGVKVGEMFFRGHSTPDTFRQFSLIAVPHDFSPSKPIQLIADDGLGNHAVMNLDYKIIPKPWRTRQITVSDRFIQQAVTPIIAQVHEVQDQQDPLKNFMQVNNALRRMNTQRLHELAKLSKTDFLWKGTFLQLSNSQVEAAFADHRQYFYHGELIDRQDHLGFDLAVTAHYPVEATNSGEVIFAEYLGIYGNTIVIDHGYGLQSLYAHLSSFEVKPGDRVQKGQVIARTGTTGLAAGDHLHFSMLVNGVQVNPLEWWDAHWVKTRITDRLGMELSEDAPKSAQDRVGPPQPAPRPEQSPVS